LNDYVASDEAVIENFSKQYAAVATDLETGREIWLTKGSVLEAVWSSMSLPGLFPAIKIDNKWLVDGGLVNPVPVSLCRALGADLVIAVNLNGDIVGKHFQKPKHDQEEDRSVVRRITDLVAEYTPSVFSTTKDEDRPPGLFETIAGSINITQDRITRSRMAGDPPDILLAPKLSHIGLLEFYRAPEAIDEGSECVQRMKSEIEHVIAMV
jgi:NTE family protein